MMHCGARRREFGAMDNTARLQRSVEKIASERTRLLAATQGLSPEQADFHATEGAWSISEIVQHVGLAETGLRDIVKKVLQADRPVYRVSYDELPITIKGVPETLTRLGFELMSPFSFMARFAPRQIAPFVIANPIIKAKAAPQAEPRRRMTLADAIAFLAEVRESTMQLVQGVKGKDLSRFQLVHPLLGQQDLYGTLELIASHDHRHILQIEDVKRHSRFPA
jgi:hypothetical protein